MQIPVIFGMLMTLLSNDCVTANQLSEKFEISKRTVYRYINVIDQSGLPLYSKLGRNGGWSILPNYKLSSLYFTKDEYERMLFNTTTSTIADEVNQSLICKLDGFKRNYNEDCKLTSSQLVVQTPTAENIQYTLTNLQQAVQSNRIVEIEYHGLKGDTARRNIEPYSLVLKNGLWYVYAYCLLRNDWRFFRVSRISQFLVHDNAFIPRMFNVDTSEIDGYATKGKQTIELTMQVHRDSRARVEDWLGLSCISEQNGKLVAKANVVYDEWLINHIIGLGSGVVVLHPAKIKHDIMSHCQKIMASYSAK